MLSASGETAVNSSRTRFTVLRLQSNSPIAGQRTGMLKANAAAVDALAFSELTGVDDAASERAPTHGVVAALSHLDAD